MSRYKLQIETGLIGLALCLTIILWSNGRALHSDSIFSSSQSISPSMSPVEEILKEMKTELQNASHLLITDPDRLAFVARNGQRQEYRFVCQSLWKNETPLIHGIQSFHFEYRNQHGQLLSRASLYKDQIRRINYFMNVSTPQKTDLTNARIQLLAVADTP